MQISRSKESAEQIEKSLSESQRLRQELNIQRDAYQSFSQRCAQLYFAVSPLWTFNHCYNFGVQSFLALFRKCFTTTMKSKVGGEQQQLMDQVYC